jgi:small redox-active disulfide protein 2
MKIQVLGSGCATCKNLYELTQTAVKELDIEAEVEYVTDVEEIIKLGVMQSPVLTIDGKIAMLGSGNLEKVKSVIKGTESCCQDADCKCGGNCCC